MLNDSIRVLNFDDSIIKQNKILSEYKAEIIDLRDIAPRARLWMDAGTRGEIIDRIRNTSKDAVTFLGSGDFHQVSGALIGGFDGNISVIDFDLHPDWDILPPRFGCGSWVTETLKNRNILKYILVGTSSDDISSISIQTGNLDALKGDRVEIYPYSHKRSLVVLKDIPENISVGIERSPFFNRIRWNELKDKDLVEFFSHVLKRLPSKDVYITIDKDCLKNEHALTNWEEGLLSLDELLLLLELIKDNANIIGVDILGDYSEEKMAGNLKRMVSYFDHPKRIKAKTLAESFVTAVNEETNIRILKTLLGT